MTVTDENHPEDDTDRPCKRCGHNRREDEDVPVETLSHCDGGCRVDDEGSGCEPGVCPCEESCCGHREDHSVHEEFVHEKDLQGTEPIGSCILGS